MTEVASFVRKLVLEKLKPGKVLEIGVVDASISVIARVTSTSFSAQHRRSELIS